MAIARLPAAVRSSRYHIKVPGKRLNYRRGFQTVVLSAGIQINEMILLTNEKGLGFLSPKPLKYAYLTA